MQTYDLTPHPAHRPEHVSAVRASVVGSDKHWLRLRWRIERSGALVIPKFAGKARADDLWQTTCFELFCRPQNGSAYCEFNFSPSERWAAYDFDDYREGMRVRPVTPDPVCTYRGGSVFSLFDVAISSASMPREPSAINFACVLDEQGGSKSLWALAHPGTKADFHDAACFTATLAAPEAS